MERRDRGDRQGAEEVEHVLAVLAAPDRIAELDRRDVGAVLQGDGGACVIVALVAADAVMDLERVRPERLGGVQRDDLAIGRDPAQVTGERGNAALAWGIGRDERGSDDVEAPIGAAGGAPADPVWSTKKGKAARLSTGRFRGCLGRANVLGARTLGALGNLELDLLTADEAVKIERGVEPAAVEEIFLRILGGDEAEAAIGNDLLDGTGGHNGPPSLPERGNEERTVRSRRGSTTRVRHEA
jgi:hypothetical protein